MSSCKGLGQITHHTLVAGAAAVDQAQVIVWSKSQLHCCMLLDATWVWDLHSATQTDSSHGRAAGSALLQQLLLLLQAAGLLQLHQLLHLLRLAAASAAAEGTAASAAVRAARCMTFLQPHLSLLHLLLLLNCSGSAAAVLEQVA
jgi:hypothetical protein